jgi:hypothetical protein
MLQQKQFLLFNVLAYLFLIFLFHEFHHGKTIDEKCASRGCIRFCCEFEAVCDKDYVGDNFNASVLPRFWRESEAGSRKIHPLFDKMKCPLVEVDQKWEYTSVSNLNDRKSFFIQI